jgi:hypothetical protein
VSRVRQSTVLGSNTITTSSIGPVGMILAVGAGAAFVVFGFYLATLIGGAVSLAIIVLASVAGGCLCLKVLTRCGLEIAHWRATRQLPPQRPLLTINRPLALPEPAPRMTVTRADYPDRVYPDERDWP